MCPISATAEVIVSLQKKKKKTRQHAPRACTEEQTIVDLKWKIERGKHLTLLPHVCGHNASFALTSACGHVALFVQLIMHVDQCTLSAERKVWEVRLLEKVVQEDV